MNNLIFLLVLWFIQDMNIDENILNQKFSSIHNDQFIEVNLESVFQYNIDYKSNYFYPEGAGIPFKFNNEIATKASFYVIDNSIKEAVFYLDIMNPDSFYKDLIILYGEPQNLSLSKAYLDKKGVDIPEKDTATVYRQSDSIPKPLSEEYKLMKRIIWYNIPNNMDSSNEFELIINNRLKTDVMGMDLLEVKLKFVNPKT